jgi:hypothetical protein
LAAYDSRTFSWSDAHSAFVAHTGARRNAGCEVRHRPLQNYRS